MLSDLAEFVMQVLTVFYYIAFISTAGVFVTIILLKVTDILSLLVFLAINSIESVYKRRKNGEQ